MSTPLSTNLNHDAIHHHVSTSSESIVEQAEDQSRTPPATLSTLRRPQPIIESTSSAYTRLAPREHVWGGTNGNGDPKKPPSLLSVGTTCDIAYYCYNECSRKALPELASLKYYELVANTVQQTRLRSLLSAIKTKAKTSKDKMNAGFKKFFKKAVTKKDAI
jgi:hypothetical protein